MCIQRVLGREVYDQQEKMAWSVVIATKGLKDFVDALLNSQEYLDNFGDNIVPYQRRRILLGREVGNLPFARMPRYGSAHREQLIAMGYFRDMDLQPYYPPQFALTIGKIITIAGGVVVGAGTVAIALAAWGLISL